MRKEGLEEFTVTPIQKDPARRCLSNTQGRDLNIQNYVFVSEENQMKISKLFNILVVLALSF